jgi:phosphatidylglycerophosphate synthase
MMAVLADALTFSRVFFALALVWLGTQGPETLPVAVLTVMLAWTTDQLDGWAARRSTTPTRLAHYDFVIDATLYAGILTYIGLAGFLSPALLGVFVAALILLWLISGRRKAVANLGVRTLDLLFAGVLFVHTRWLALLVAVWLLALGLLYRHRLAARVPAWWRELLQLAGWKASGR